MFSLISCILDIVIIIRVFCTDKFITCKNYYIPDNNKNNYKNNKNNS